MHNVSFPMVYIAKYVKIYIVLTRWRNYSSAYLIILTGF